MIRAGHQEQLRHLHGEGKKVEAAPRLWDGGQSGLVEAAGRQRVSGHKSWDEAELLLGEAGELSS